MSLAQMLIRLLYCCRRCQPSTTRGQLVEEPKEVSMRPPAANWCVRLSAVVAGLVISFGLLVPAATFASPPIVTAAADTLPVEDDTTPPDPALGAAGTAPPADTSLPDPSAPAGGYAIH